MHHIKKPHYGWVIVFACFIMAFTAITALINCMGIFIKPVSEALGFSRSSFSLYYTCISMTTMLFSPKMGSILQKYSYKYVILICSLGSSIPLFIFPFCRALWQFYLVAVVCGIFHVGLSTMAISIIINRWFIKGKTTAMAIAFSGSSLGSMVFNPLVSSVIETHGWGSAYVMLGVLILGVNMPASLLLLKNSPAEMGLLPYGAEQNSDSTAAASINNIGVMRGEAMRMPYFWILCLCTLLFGLMGSGIMQHINSYLTDLGYTVAFAASIVSIAMGIATAGKLVLGVAFDRLGGLVGTAIICVFVSLASLTLVFAQVPGVPYLFAICYGIAFAVMSIPAPSLTAELFGSKDYGRIYGVVVMCLSGGMSLGSPLSAVIYDKTGSYAPAWILYAGMALAVISMIFYCVTGMRRRSKCTAEA